MKILSRYKDSIYAVIIYIAFLIVMLITLSNKVNFHIDETYSYGLANGVNSSISMDICDGVVYEDTTRVFMNYLTTNETNRFNYANVFYNQSIDVHPPLYYVLLHTICSFFPNTFSIWYAGVINILFALATLYVLRKICRILWKDISVCNLFSLFFILSFGILNAISFFRMYVMAMFWITLLIYLFLKYTENTSLSNYAFIGLVTVLAALTHYYCIVFAVIISVVHALLLLRKKAYKNVFALCVFQGIAGVCAISIFPSMLEHMFKGYHGKRAIENMSNVSDYVERLRTFYGFLNNQLFGGVFGYILLVVVLAFFVLKITKKDFFKEKVEKETVEKSVILFLPPLLYFLLVAKIATFQTDRYIFPIYAIGLLACFGITYMLVGAFFKNSKKLAVLGAFLCMITFLGFQKNEFTYLYRDSTELLENASKFENIDCLCVYSSSGNVQPFFLEASNYKTITFASLDNIWVLQEYDFLSNDELIVSLIGIENNEQYLQEVASYYTGYSVVGSFAYGTSYYFYR